MGFDFGYGVLVLRERERERWIWKLEILGKDRLVGFWGKNVVRVGKVTVGRVKVQHSDVEIFGGRSCIFSASS